MVLYVSADQCVPVIVLTEEEGKSRVLYFRKGSFYHMYRKLFRIRQGVEESLDLKYSCIREEFLNSNAPISTLKLQIISFY